ncbi:MAG: serine/threonine-protein kinase [Myxococcota bacterium]
MAEEVPANVPVSLPQRRGFPRPFGRYILEKNLSRGGMGEVHLAVAKGVGTRCVIKTIRGDLTGDKEFIGRFADEAKIMVRMTHDNIIRVFDCGKVGTDYYIAMEYVYGRDLGDVLDRAYERGEPMPKEYGLFLTKQILKGLDYAHNLTDEHNRPMRLVHRDISPQNILIGFDGSVKIIDFGLARTELLPARTQGALAVGKYGYMSPEQARHERIDGRADLYSVGVMLFEVFTGDRLVDEQDQATLWARVLSPKHRRPSTVVPDLPREVDDMIMRAVEVRVEDRYADARAMLKSVEGFRTKSADKNDLIQYLRYLYPTADFSPPPLPDLMGGESDVGEQSMVIAMSEEGAKSVFGRGQLPIEWTKQIRWADVQAEMEKKKARRVEEDEPKKKSRNPSELRGWNDGTGASEETVIQHETDVTRDDRSSGAVDTLDSYGAVSATIRQLSAQDDPTTIARAENSLPEGVLSDFQQTAYDNKVRVRSPDDDKKGRLGHAAIRSDFRDDEQTVMMSAPPRAGWAGEDMSKDDVVAETRLSMSPAQPPTPSTHSKDPGGRQRAIQERNSFAPDPPPSPPVKKAPAVVIRQTAGADPTAIVEKKRDREREAEIDRTREVTSPPPSGPNYLFVGIFLMGLAVIAVLVILLFKT